VKVILLTIAMLIGNLLIRVAVAAIIGAVVWLPVYLLLDLSSRALFVIIFVVFLPLCGLWECSDMTGLSERIWLLKDQRRQRANSDVM
jgi:hypothetical protein